LSGKLVWRSTLSPRSSAASSFPPLANTQITHRQAF